jgi:hypothetical protein
MFGVLFFKVLYLKHHGVPQDVVSKQDSTDKVLGEDTLKYMETVEELEE